jgi:hypothetical protein
MFPGARWSKPKLPHAATRLHSASLRAKLMVTFGKPLAERTDLPALALNLGALDASLVRVERCLWERNCQPSRVSVFLSR